MIELVSAIHQCLNSRRDTDTPQLNGPTTAAAAASAKVFELVELLEAILVKVDDERTLLASQRVSKIFQSTTKGSVRLQRKLWFQPAPEQEGDRVFPANPLLFKSPKFDHGLVVMCCLRRGEVNTPSFGRPEQWSYLLFPIIRCRGNGILLVRSGTWRDKLVARDGEEFECEAYYQNLAGLSSFLFQFYPSRKCESGLTAGMLAEWIVAEMSARVNGKKEVGF